MVHSPVFWLFSLAFFCILLYEVTSNLLLPFFGEVPLHFFGEVPLPPTRASEVIFSMIIKPA